MMTPTRSGICVVALLLLVLPLLLSSCSSGSDKAPVAPVVDEAPAASEAPAPAPEPTPEAVEDKGPAPLSPQIEAFLASVSEEASAVPNPLSGQDEAVRKGEEEYQSLCAQCHGKTGNSEDAPAARALGVTPPDFSDPQSRGRITDGARFAAMKNGIPDTAMQAFGAAMSDNQIWQILAYVETLAKGAVDEPTP